MKPIPPCLAAAVMSLAARGECARWADFAMVGTYNAMRHLKARGWIEDANAHARAAFVREVEDGRPIAGSEEIFERHPYRWRLTPAGLEAAERIRNYGRMP